MKIILKLFISLFLLTEIGVASEIKVFEFTEASVNSNTFISLATPISVNKKRLIKSFKIIFINF